MGYFIEIVKGLLMAFGIMLGFIFSVTLLMKAKTKANTRHSAEELLAAFKEYLTDLKNLEQYEDIEEVMSIVAKLEEATVPEIVNNYTIKSNPSLIIITKDEATEMRVTNTLKVIGRN